MKSNWTYHGLKPEYPSCKEYMSSLSYFFPLCCLVVYTHLFVNNVHPVSIQSGSQSQSFASTIHTFIPTVTYLQSYIMECQKKHKYIGRRVSA